MSICYYGLHIKSFNTDIPIDLNYSNHKLTDEAFFMGIAN